MTNSPNPSPSAAPKPVRVITVTSGKGGVGKTNLTANLALALTQLGQKVLIWDADLGLANIDVIFGLESKFNIQHLLSGEKNLSEILVEGPLGIKIMPASSGILEMSELTEGHRLRLLSEFDEWGEDLDIMLIDTGAGIGSNVLYFNLAAQERLVVVTNEPTSITDVYALIKVLHTRYQQKTFSILPNMVGSAKEAKSVYELLVKVCDQYLPGVALNFAGFIPRDEEVTKAVRRQKPFYLAAPQSEASRKLEMVAKTLLATRPTRTDSGGLAFFLNRLANLGGRVD